MSFRRRIQKIEKLLPATHDDFDKEIERVSEWLIKSSAEFRECVRQLFRLQCKAGENRNIDQWPEPYREQAISFNIRINKLIDQHKHKESVTD